MSNEVRPYNFYEVEMCDIRNKRPQLKEVAAYLGDGDEGQAYFMPIVDLDEEFRAEFGKILPVGCLKKILPIEGELPAKLVIEGSER